MGARDREFLGCGRRVFSGEGGGPAVQSALLGAPAVYAPDRPYDTVHVRLDLDVDLSRRRLSGSCSTTVSPRREGLKDLSFDAVELKISKVLLDGRPVRFTNKDGKLVVHAPAAMKEGSRHVVEARYAVEEPGAGLHFVRPGPHAPDNPTQLWSQSQPEDARRWFPCHDAPGEKATSEVRVTVPSGFRAVSNGVLVEHSRKSGKELWHWRMDRPHSIYLITLVVGRFSEIVERWDGIPLVYYCEKGREADARRGFAKTAKAMQVLSEKTGVRYPYARYAQVAVAEYPGGMEHTTATTQTDACLIDAQAALDHDLDTLVAHELAHQWFGDLVTCAEWPHAWLNEGFATYSEFVFLEADRGRDEALYELLLNRRAYLDEDSARYRRPIVCRTYKDPWTIFDRHLYEKGCWVLRMLHAELGDALFWKGVGHWLRKHRDGIAETQDLVAAFEEATGRNLQGFFDQWVYRGGHPTLRVNWTWDPKSKKGELHVIQNQETSEANPPYRFLLKARVTGRGWTRDMSEAVSEKEHRFVWKLPSEPLDVELDPDVELLYSLEFRKPVSMWRRQLAGGSTVVARSIAAPAVARGGGEDAALALARAAKRAKFWGEQAEIVSALGSVRGPAALAGLRRLLGSLTHPKARRAVVEELARRGDASDARRLAPLARGARSLLVRAEATRALGLLDPRTHRATIERNLSAKTYRDGVAAAAVSALSASRGADVPRRLLALSKPPHKFGPRIAAIRALGEYASVSPEAVPQLCALLSDRDERVALIACTSLGRAADERSLPDLEKAAKSHGNPRVRVYATEAAARVRGSAKTKSKLVKSPNGKNGRS